MSIGGGPSRIPSFHGWSAKANSSPEDLSLIPSYYAVQFVSPRIYPARFGIHRSSAFIFGGTCAPLLLSTFRLVGISGRFLRKVQFRLSYSETARGKRGWFIFGSVADARIPRLYRVIRIRRRRSPPPISPLRRRGRVRRFRPSNVAIAGE